MRDLHGMMFRALFFRALKRMLACFLHRLRNLRRNLDLILCVRIKGPTHKSTKDDVSISSARTIGGIHTVDAEYDCKELNIQAECRTRSDVRVRELSSRQ